MPKTSPGAMAFEPRVAVLDACVLYPFHLRNIIVQTAADRLLKAHWTDEIHDEWISSLAARAPAIPRERLQSTRRLMNQALPRATVVGYEDLIPTISLPDPKDRHVVAAAIASGASVILTWNLRDFPATALAPHGLRAQTPDGFLVGLYDQVPDLAVASLANARRNLTSSLVSPADFVAILYHQQLSQLAKRVRSRLIDL